MWDPYAEFQSATLPNGLMVYAAYWPRPWEAMGFLIHSGAEYDPIGLEGISHFLEHLVSENAIVQKEVIEAFFEDCGGRVHLGVTSYPSTYYRFFVPIDKTILSKAFSIFGHMLLSAKIERYVERERQTVINEFRHRYPLKFQFDIDTREHKALYRGHWLERFTRPLGNPESVSRIKQNDLQLYYDMYYTPANMSIVGVGGLQLSEIIDLLSESPFAINKKGVRTLLPIPDIDVTPPLETRYVFEMSKHIVAPMEVGVYRSVAKIPGNINGRAVRIIKEMLIEVLNEEIRERRAWAYAINVSQHNFREFHEFSISCDSLALKAINHIEEVIEACIASISDREDLFERIKHRALASNFMIDETAKYVCDDVLDDLATYQRIITLEEMQEDLEQVTMNDIKDILQWLRPERRWTLIMRP